MPIDESLSPDTATTDTVAAAAADDVPTASAQRWRCTVCGYVHTGPEQPARCPICGADRSKFVPVQEKPAETETPRPSGPPASETQWQRLYRLATDQMVALHAHPISVHIPNGVAPVAIFFALLALITGSRALEQAAFFNLVIVLLAMPFVLFSGYNDWQKRFGGPYTYVFVGKMICGGVFSVLSLVIVIWRLVEPAILVPGADGRAIYVLLHLLLLGVGAFAGYLGGKLVFHGN